MLRLYDRRRQRPSRRKAPVAGVQRILGLYSEKYLGIESRAWQNQGLPVSLLLRPMRCDVAK